MTTKNKKKELKKEQNLEELMPTVEKTEIVDETKWEKIRRISKDKYNEISWKIGNTITKDNPIKIKPLKIDISFIEVFLLITALLIGFFKSITISLYLSFWNVFYHFLFFSFFFYIFAKSY